MSDADAPMTGRMSSGTELWKHAKERIPGGSMLLSKRAELQLPA